MHTGNVSTALRRSSRVPTAVPILVTSLAGKHFSDVCETLVVNAHGCAILTRVKLETGVPLHLHSKEGRDATARVVSCQAMGSDQRSWMLTAKLDHPQNFWGLRDCPKDWASLGAVPPKPPQTSARISTPVSQQALAPLAPPAETVFERVARQLDAQVKVAIADSLLPLQAEIEALKERLARREANPNRFEVSLSSIPPELEQKIESRLQTDLGPRVVDEARQQSAHLLASAQAMIDQRTNEAHETFLRGVAKELKVVEQRAQEISAHISENTQDYLRSGLEQFNKELLDGGNSLKRLSEELLEFLKYQLNTEHDARRGDLEQLRAVAASESARLQQQIEYLDARVAKLDESARSLESGLDQRLSRISSDTVRDTRSQFEHVASAILEELTARSSRVLDNHLQDTSGNMKAIQDGVVASVSESLKGQAANALQAFEQSTEQLAKLSVERCRHMLEAGLNAVAKSLNEQFRSETDAREDRE